MKTIGLSIWVKFHDLKWIPHAGEQQTVFPYETHSVYQTKWYVYWLFLALDITATTKVAKQGEAE